MPVKYAITIGSSLAPLLDQIKEAGADPQQALGSLPLNYKDIKKPNLILPTALCGKIFARAEHITNNEIIGWDVGISPDLDDMHPEIISALTKFTCPNDFLYFLHKTVTLQTSHLRLYFRFHANQLRISFQSTLPCKHAAYSNATLRTAARLITLLRFYFGKDWKPSYIALDKHTIQNKPDLESLIKVRIKPTKNMNYITIPQADNFFDQKLFTEQSSKNLGINNIIRIIHDWERIYETIDSPKLNIDTLASIYDLSERTIQRELKAVGTSFQNEVKKVKAQNALRLIAQNMPFEDICTQIGYDNKSSFNRLCKEQFGLSPTELRWILKNDLQSWHKLIDLR